MCPDSASCSLLNRALSEKIVSVLPRMKCPHQLEPHQIQGMDFIHIFPVVQVRPSAWILASYLGVPGTQPAPTAPAWTLGEVWDGFGAAQLMGFLPSFPKGSRALCTTVSLWPSHIPSMTFGFPFHTCVTVCVCVCCQCTCVCGYMSVEVHMWGHTSVWGWLCV